MSQLLDHQAISLEALAFRAFLVHHQGLEPDTLIKSQVLYQLS